MLESSKICKLHPTDQSIVGTSNLLIEQPTVFVDDGGLQADCEGATWSVIVKDLQAPRTSSQSNEKSDEVWRV